MINSNEDSSQVEKVTHSTKAKEYGDVPLLTSKITKRS